MLGTNPADAMRMFIAALNRSGGFPCEVRIFPTYEAIHAEEDAIDLCDHLAEEMVDEAR